MTFKELREQSGMGLKQFSDYFGVPYRTVQNWNAGSNDCPEYLMNLFIYKLRSEGKLTGEPGMKFEYEREKAIRIKVLLGGNIEKYATAFLAIYNNVKNDNQLLKVYNDYDDGVYVVCETKVRDAAVKFLEQFGEIVRIETVEIVRVGAYGYEHPDDFDLEFLEIEE